MTGLGMKAANVILVLSNSDPIITLIIAAVVTIILGLGMPTPSAYILAAVLVGPALAKLGYPVLQSHLFLLYYAVLSALTPPIAVAALAAAAIANEDPFRIAFSAVRLAVVGFLLPFVFVWNPGLLLLAGVEANILAVIGGVVATVAIAIAVEATYGAKASTIERLALVAGAVAAITPQSIVSLAGIAFLLAMLVRYSILLKRNGEHHVVSDVK
tara:strand:- start:2 stop:643 length:642 start_codon:yes stop_codon:yes gene_type:complete